MSQAGEEATQGARPANRGWGGSRNGSGRKSKGAFSPLLGDMDYAKGLISTLMRDESQPAELRARCALAILIKGVLRKGTHRSSHSAGPGDDSADTGVEAHT